MEEYSIRITRQARDHLREIRRYIEKELLSPMAAKHTIAAIKAEMQSLSNMPHRIHFTPEEPWRAFVRRTREKNFYVYFWIDEENKKVQIIGVIYVKRDQVKRLEGMDME